MIQIRPSGRATERRRSAALRALPIACLLAVSLFHLWQTYAHSQDKPPLRSDGQIRLQIINSEDDRPIPGATVSLVYWQRTNFRLEKNEIETKSDEHGMAQFSGVPAGKVAVSVSMKGFRAYWHWLQTTSPQELVRIRLEAWANRRK
jgi:Carboxypeptidase regulatory-like domain